MRQTGGQISGVDQAIQAQLAQRTLLLGARAAKSSARDLAVEVDDIRRLAMRHGMYPAASVAQALESALARGDSGPLVTGWIAILAEAIGSDRHDGTACDSYAALCTVRLAS